jgi:phosphoglycerol transferase MdoB-like AlkP superfamily enzyme
MPDSYINLTVAEKTFLYSDAALGNFIQNLKQKKLFDSSLIIITGDHGESYSDEDNETKIYNVPLLIIDHLNKGTNKQLCSHSDIAEYVLSRTGYKGLSHLMGQGLMPNTKLKAFYRSYQNELFKVTDTCIYRYNLISKELVKINCEENLYVKNYESIANHTKAYETIVNSILSYYSVNRFLFENGLYRKSQ